MNATLTSPPDSGDEAVPVPRRRQRNTEPQETIDELAIENKRISLLDRVEAQLRGVRQHSRLLFGFTTENDKKLHGSIETEFSAWRSGLDDPEELTGVMIYIGNYVLHFLEGDTDILFKALEFFHTLSHEAPGGASVKSTPQQTTSPSRPSNVPRPANAAPEVSKNSRRAGLLSGLRILHFTELHGVRTSVSWCLYVHNSKPAGAAIAVEESNCPEIVFSTYKKMLLLCLAVSRGTRSSRGREDLSAAYNASADKMPTADEVSQLMSKAAAEFLFNYTEFVKTFVAPVHLTLHSELLWPVPPALVY